ncbi:NADP-dependent oxidoreductase [Chelatococcus reniformis]|uniref:NADP-dependent oxidoreductase n=1 Tax=Chelatococcus reniformis TaxID=1494448 RepID=A0A916ULJ8_9HYPH|nr:NADP-dependent oxidoreductase [Chelatococcus reniformis]GGC78130.1 NADP-dependent oxidoreductase [Chelatococcus reniformis]
MNRQIVLASRPEGLPALDNFALVSGDMPVPGPGQFLLAHHYLGLAPAARIRMGAARSYAPPLPIGGVIYGQAVGRVGASRHPQFQEGDLVVSTDAGWQEYSVSDGARASRIDAAIAPERVWLGALGVSGLTAYVGLLDVGGPRATDTVVVSAAAGAVGSAVGQIARIKGCRVVGIAGGSAKCRYVTQELGLDASVDYHAADFARQLADACHAGIDLYFDNVGGAVRDTVWPLMNDFGRVVVCGQISEYGATAPAAGPGWFSLLTKRLSVRGFLLRDHEERHAAAVADMSRWYREGRIKGREQIVEGLEQAPAAFIRMLQGGNLGKTLVRLTTS